MNVSDKKLLEFLNTFLKYVGGEEMKLNSAAEDEGTTSSKHWWRGTFPTTEGLGVMTYTPRDARLDPEDPDQVLVQAGQAFFDFTSVEDGQWVEACGLALKKVVEIFVFAEQ